MKHATKLGAGRGRGYDGVRTGKARKSFVFLCVIRIVLTRSLKGTPDIDAAACKGPGLP